MQNIIRGFKHISGYPVLFMSLSFSLLILSFIQVSCPICGSIVTKDSTSDLANLSVQEVESDLVDYKITYPGCGYSYSYCIYEVKITIFNEGSRPLSTPILIHGTLPEEAVKVHPTWAEKNAKLVNIEILGGEGKQIQENVQLCVVGLDVGKDVVQQVQFSIITDPMKIKANCPVCSGEGKVPFTQWLTEVTK